ncbi:iron-siderophore ABC transporter substrate-binding protein [Salinifilum aidingensis]
MSLSSARAARSPVPALSRRGFLAGTVGAAAAGLAACAGGSGSGEAPRGGPGFPVTIPNRYGRAEIPGRPRAIASLGITDHDVLLMLGILPAGLTRWGPWGSGVGPWVRDELDDQLANGGEEPRLFGSELDLEGVIGLEPDVMIGVQSALTRDEYQRLSSFNPVVAQPPNSIDYGVPWKQQAETIGRAVGMRGETSRLITDTQGALDRTREQHPEFEGRTHVTVRTDAQGTYAAYTRQDARTALLEQLGLTLSPAIQQLDDGGEFNVKISKEQVSLLDADVVVVTTAQPADVATVRADPLLNNLPAAKRGSLVLLEDYDLTMALGSATVSSIPWVLERLPRRLSRALG